MRVDFTNLGIEAGNQTAKSKRAGSTNSVFQKGNKIQKEVKVSTSTDNRAMMKNYFDQMVQNNQKKQNTRNNDYTSSGALKDKNVDKDNSAKQMAKALKIASRMQKGDKVSPSDERYLMEYSSALYMTSKAMQTENAGKNSKDYKKTTEEENQGTSEKNDVSEEYDTTAVDNAIRKEVPEEPVEEDKDTKQEDTNKKAEEQKTKAVKKDLSEIKKIDMSDVEIEAIR